MPGTFAASAASSIAATSFSANWTASAGATACFLDVSTSSTFASFVTGYNGLNVSNVVTYSVNTNLTCGTTYYYRVRANNACGTSANSNTIPLTTTSCPCGSSLSISHTIGTVAPETKSVTYGVVTSSLSGASKCWITQNLGSTNQASSPTDATDASAGWYWQFNRQQGYKVGPTPAWTITAIDEISDWLSANDPCTIELGAGWRIPTYTEWLNADANGPWANYTDAYNSVLKLHAAGYLFSSDGSLLNRGAFGIYWSGTQNSSTNVYGWYLFFSSGVCNLNNSRSKAFGMPLRCLRN